MKFARIIGKDLKDDTALIKKAEEKLTKVFMNLAVSYTNKNVGDTWGGDPLIFTLMQPVDHIASRNIKTAATDGKVFYWDPRFVLKQDEKGLRIVAAHEAFHALYLHPTRRGSRNPRLWNIAVDYIVNGQVMDDFRTRNLDPKEMFTKHLGKYMSLPEYLDFLRNPLKKKAGFEKETDVNAVKGKKGKKKNLKMPAPDEDRDLTPEEIEELEKEETREKFFFADPDIEHDMKRPERIYDLLLEAAPKCPECGRLGVIADKKKDQNGKDQDQDGKKETKKSKEKKDGADGSGGKNPGQKGQKGKDNGDSAGDPSEDHEHGEDGSPCDHNCNHGNQPGNGDGQGDGNNQGQNQGQGQGGSCDHDCGTCGGDGSFDIFDFGGLVDDHMDTRESEEKLAKRFAEAIEAAKKMAGHIPAGLEDELGILTAPKISWTDIIRSQFRRTREGNERSDWTRYRSRPLSAGLLVPKRKTYTVNAGVLLDTSGSMSQDDMALGISQLQSLDERNEVVITYADSEVYFDQSVKIRKFNTDELSSKIKPVGRGGTVWGQYFSEYEQHLGKLDFIIVMSDLYLGDDQATWVDPGIPVYFLCTSGNTSFSPPFGKVIQLH